jgi:general secretion pathway protein K
MDGVSAQLYAAIAPYLCAHPTFEPSQININMLGPEDAPILVGLTGGTVSPISALEIIADRPPGGWDNVEAFWAHRALANLEIDREALQQRTALESRYIAVQGTTSINEIEMAVRLLFLFQSEGSEALLLSREIGAPS